MVYYEKKWNTIGTVDVIYQKRTRRKYKFKRIDFNVFRFRIDKIRAYEK